MATKVVMEALSPTMEEGRLVKWLKNEGDAVKSGDVLAEVETDKAVMELVARGDGVIRKRIANEGDSSAVGTLLAVIGGADENIDAILGAAAAPASAAAPATAADAAPATDAVPTAPATPDQSQGEASAPPQEKPRAAAAPYTAQAQPPLPPAQSGGWGKPTGSSTVAAQSSNGGRSKASPLARRLANEKGVDLG
ncbi:MAG: biotin/lipoyl-containing protein, partial [Gemmatimonadaceae bacterium]